MQELPKYPTFQDKYGQAVSQSQDTSFEQNRQPTQAPQQNPWSQLNAPTQEEAPQVQLAPQPWEYTGR